MYQSQKLLNPVEIENKTINYLFKDSDFKFWIAEEQRSLQSNDVFDVSSRKFKQLNLREAKDGVIEYLTYYRRDLTLHQVKLLTLISWFVPKDVQAVLQLATYEYYNKYNLYDHIDLRIYMSSKEICLLYLSESNVTTQSYFGQLGNLVNFLSKIVNSDSKHKRSVFQPLRIKYDTTRKIEKYTGYTKHYKDRGSPRPDIEYMKNWTEDQSYYDYIFKKYNNIKELDATLDFLTGWLI